MQLTPEQWRRVKEITASALELTPAEREEFIRTASAGDEVIYREARSLIQYATDRGPAATLIKGRYRLESVLGRGGFAVAYLAFDQQLHNRKVVVKLLNDHEGDAYVFRKFEEETQALAALEHPNIVAPLDCGRTGNNVPFLVMQFVEGKTLRAWMRERAPERSVLASIIRQLGHALAFAHERGIVHRDIKPENVMVQSFADGSVHVRLIDFGIASIAPVAGTATRIVGSISYMAPEQFRGEVSPATDVYGLGVLVYELLTGQTPFDGRDPIAMVAQQRAARVSFSSSMKEQWGGEVWGLLRKALAYDAKQRPINILAFASGLATELSQEAPRSSARRRTSSLAAGAAVAMLTGGLLLFVVSKRPAPVPNATKDAAVRMVAPAAATAGLVPLLDVVLEHANLTERIASEPATGVLSLRQNDKFRLRVRSLSEGHLYIFGQSLDNAEVGVLFPSITANNARSLTQALSNLSIPAQSWFTFGEKRGSEKLIFIWSAGSDAALERTERFANQHDRGRVRDEVALAKIEHFLTLPNLLERVGDQFQLRGRDRSCGWIVLRHE